MNQAQDIIVVGGGIAGLTAAYYLQQAGHSVQVLEAADHIGGRMRTLEWEGFELNPGAQFFTGGDVYLMELAEELGLRDQVHERYSEGLYFATYRDGQIYPVNFLSIGSYLRWKGVSFKARLAMLKLIPHMLPYFGKEIYHMERNPGADKLSYEEFFRRQINSEMFDYWAYPTFETNCSYDGQDLSKKAFLSLLAGYLNSKSYYFERGMGTLPEELAKHVPVSLGARVSRINVDASGIEVTYQRGDQEHNVRAGKLVMAAPGHQALALFENPRPAWSAFLSKVTYPAVATQFHVFEHPDFNPGTAPADGAMFPPPEPGFSIAFTYFVARQGKRWLLMTEPKAHTYDPSEAEEVSLQRSWDDVVKVHPQLAGTRVAARQFYWPGKVPAFPAGYLDATATFWADPQEDPVFFCGDYLAGPGTGAALFTGRECAQRVRQSMQSEDIQ